MHSRLADGPLLGLRQNWRQFSLLVAINAFVGAMVGVERTALPLLARDTFHLTSATLTLSFLIAFGLVKAVSNLAAGHAMTGHGRRTVLLAGWACALPVAPLILSAHGWGQVVVANVFLGLNQGLAWSATVVMKIDLAGPRRRGLALGLNEAAGYGAVAVAAYAAASVAARHSPRNSFWLTAVISVGGLALSLFARDTRAHAAAESAQLTSTARPPAFWATFRRTTWGRRALSVSCASGLVNQLNDALAWGLLPGYLASRGLSATTIGAVAAVYPATWALSQPAFGALSDTIGRAPLLVAGFLLQSAGIAVFAGPPHAAALIAGAATLGLGTGMVYPTLIAVIGDHTTPAERPAAIGTYRLWRDLGYVVGAVVVGISADAWGARPAIVTVAAITAIPAALAFWVRPAAAHP